MKRKVYIFNGTSRAANYGIGTYIDQLILCLKNTDIDFEVVYLYSKVKEVEVVEKEGYRQISIPSIRTQGRMSSHYYTRNVAYVLKEFIPERKDTLNIFHLNFMNSSELVTYLKKMFKCRVLLVAHYTNWSFSLLGDYAQLKYILNQKSSKRKPFEKEVIKNFKEDVRMIQKCDHFVCVGEHTLSSFKEVGGIDTEKSSVICNCLQDVYKNISEEEKLAFKKEYHISPHTKILFFAGRLDSGKGVFELVEAFKELSKLRQDVRLIMAGEGDFGRLVPATQECCCSVTFTGRLEKEKLYRFYQMADIGIVPSMHEEFGLVAVEMMMHQLPVIVSDAGGLAEIVEDGVNGLKVPVIKEKDKRTLPIPQLVEKITTLLDDEEYARKLGKKGRETFLEKYELTCFRKKMLDLYLNI
ncbi:TIGR04157 family glycosyltransferase [Parabacteroides pacaensis]|uniref:TIGR04157 family glycosyltransferase n=1 Tax=Parabacteroides pacaensis TaxID=2086575 RepID=UPI000D10C095|nr:TIGR04157 family glycosyltransferase [Parabacteroides pacaensis]